ncbi:hypothetical protein A2U01_0000609 [Trifolium medium]|uniref:HMA domain-containing protein n=1 Tax=Trifolium medium TaxID=97028 RepID=A0A392LY10_9FABA|nr:hypothetical protein [Trifolium medium]
MCFTNGFEGSGVNMVTIDKKKETVTVEGIMNVKVLIDKLGKKFKREVEVIQPKKVEDKKKKNQEGEGGNKKDVMVMVVITVQKWRCKHHKCSDENPNACSVM